MKILMTILKVSPPQGLKMISMSILKLSPTRNVEDTDEYFEIVSPPPKKKVTK